MTDVVIAEDDGVLTKTQAAGEAAALLRAGRFGALSTISVKHEGWPHGSVVPYALSRTGEPLVLLAAIAEHTRNVLRDDRVCLLVGDAVPEGDDVQAHGRIGLMARARPLARGGGDAEAWDDAWARYVARVPKARGYGRAHDFTLFALQPVRARWIGGFGRIFWLDGAHFAVDPAADPLAAAAPGAIAHMNADHADALLACARGLAGLDAHAARMVGLDRHGFDLALEGPEPRARIDFDAPVGPERLRAAMVELTRRARARLERVA